MLFLSVATVLLTIYLIYMKFISTYPPGPLLPLFMLPWIPGSRYYKKEQLQILLQLEEIYGSIFSVVIGSKRVIIMCDFEDVRRIYAKNIAVRNLDILNSSQNTKYGITHSNGTIWKIQHHLFLKCTKNNSFSADGISAAVEMFWPNIKETIDKGNAKKHSDFDLLLSELIMTIFTDFSVFSDGQPSRESVAIFMEARRNGVQYSLMELWYLFPWLRKIAPKWSGYEKYLSIYNDTIREIETLIKLHVNQPSTTRDDFIDVYLQNINDSTCKLCAVFDTYQERLKCLISTIENVITGGDGLINGFTIVLFLITKDVQRKMRDEIKELGYIPTSNYSTLVPYCTAAVRESQRINAQCGYGAGHIATMPISCGKYIIPAETEVFPAGASILLNNRYWKDADKFQPERFLGEDGQCKVIPREWIPFGLGVRRCPAFFYAMDICICLAVHLVPEYEWSVTMTATGKPPNRSNIKEELTMKGMSMVLPKDFNLQFTHVD